MTSRKRYFFSPWLDKISEWKPAKTLILLLFLLLAALQVGLSIYPSIRSESAARNGQEYKFRTEAYDPADPFRGRYLQFRLDTSAVKNRLEIDESESRSAGRQICYLTIAVGQDGIAYFDEALPKPPADGKDYIKARYRYGSFDLPMQQYFLDEETAPAAEQAFFADPNNCFIILRVQKGTAVVTGMYVGDLLIDKVEF
jgi:uncharacterized membrane-anchored protein